MWHFSGTLNKRPNVVLLGTNNPATWYRTLSTQTIIMPLIERPTLLMKLPVPLTIFLLLSIGLVTKSPASLAGALTPATSESLKTPSVSPSADYCRGLPDSDGFLMNKNERCHYNLHPDRKR
jgi:hypothetical protein